MIWIECFGNWSTTDGTFVPSAHEQPIYVNAEYIRAADSPALGVTRIYVNLSDHVGPLYTAGDPVALIQRCRNARMT